MSLLLGLHYQEPCSTIGIFVLRGLQKSTSSAWKSVSNRHTQWIACGFRAQTARSPASWCLSINPGLCFSAWYHPYPAERFYTLRVCRVIKASSRTSLSCNAQRCWAAIVHESVAIFPVLHLAGAGFNHQCIIWTFLDSKSMQECLWWFQYYYATSRTARSQLTNRTNRTTMHGWEKRVGNLIRKGRRRRKHCLDS